MTNPSLILPQSPAFGENNVYAARVEDGAVPLYNVLPLDFTRASNGTRVNKDGLLEKVRTNLLTYSNDFSGADWSAVTASITTGQSGYDGSSDASLLTATSSNANIYQLNSTTGVLSFSVYAKGGTAGWVRLRFDNTSSSDVNTWVDLSDGSIGSDNGIATNVESIGSGWYRITSQVNTTDLNNVRIYPSDSNGNNSTSGNIYIQDAQLEQGLVATDYIPTTTAPVSVGAYSNMPRITYPIGGGCGSLLLEPQRTNVITNSNDFVTGANNVTTTANNATSPEGYQNADLITGNAGTLTKLVNFNGASTGAYTLSVFAKYNTQQWIQLGAGAIATYANFDIQNGVLGNTNGTSQIEDYGNGWYRCSMVMVSGTPLSHYVGIVTNGTAARLATTSSTNSFWAYGIQSEIGTYPTSYIPTNGAAATRVADACSKTGISDLIGQSEGTFFVEFSSSSDTIVNEQISLSDGTDSNTVKFVMGSVISGIQAESRLGGVTQFSIKKTTSDYASVKKMAISYKQNDVVFYIDGVQIGTDSSVTIPALSVFDFASGSGAFKATGNVYQATIYKTRLSNTELANLTTL